MKSHQDNNKNFNLISLKSVCKNYGHIKALKNINLEINSGDSISIFGENGAGKSTLLKILSLQSKNSSGKITFNGKTAKELNDDFRLKFGVISHNSFLYNNMSAYENLMFYGSLYNVSNLENKVIELLKKFDIYKRRDDLIRTYSRGMLQRVSIARALIHSPQIIFLDEPYTGLDKVASINLSNILKEEISNKKTLILITHDLEVGLDIGNKILILNKGEIVFNENIENIDIPSFQDKYINFASNMEISK